MHDLCRLVWVLVASMTTSVLAATASPSSSAVQITDDRGVLIRLAQAPQRIVSLLPSLTETVCALGACQRLVGVDRFSNFPATVRELPQVGSGLEPNMETLIALKPDVVLLATSSRAIERLQSLGISVVALEPQTHGDVRRVLEQLGQLLALQTEATQLWREMEAVMDAVAQSMPARTRNTRVYVEVNSALYAGSDASFIGQTLSRLGVRNIVPAHLGIFPKLNPEFVVRADPDLIVVGEGDAQSLRQRPGWASLRAVREQRVCAFSPAQFDILVRPGPRMAQAARIMAKCLEDKTR